MTAKENTNVIEHNDKQSVFGRVGQTYKCFKDLLIQNGRQVVKYAVSGGIGGVLQVSFLYLFVDILDLWYIYGVISAFVIALVVVFSLQKFWTFRDNSISRIHRQSFFYTAISLLALILNVALMFVFVEIFDIWHIASQVMVVGMVGILSFLLNKTITFSILTINE